MLSLGVPEFARGQTPETKAQLERPDLLNGEGGPLGKYRARDAPQVTFSDSPRLDALIRGGNLYLSLRDAIALAIENNLDVEFQRFTPLIAETDLQRARAGGVARGLNSTVREGPSGLGSGPQQSQLQGISGAPGSGPQGQSTQLQGGVDSTQTAGAVASSGSQFSSAGPAVPSLDPALVGSIGWNRSNRPQTNTFITGTNQLTTSAASGDLRIQKGFLVGGTASLGLDSTRQNTNNLRSDINPATTGGLAFSYVQPLLRGFGIAVNNRFIRIARNNRQVSDLVFEQQVIGTAYAVARLYWDLVSLVGEARVQEQSVSLAEELVKQNTLQEEAGTVAPIDVVRSRAEVANARRDLTVARTRVRQQETILKDYITRQSVDTGALATLRVIPTDTISPPPQEPIAPIQDLVASALRRRPELAQANLQVENSRISLSGSRSALLPALDLVVNARSNTLFGSVNPLPPVSTGGTGNNLQRTPDPAFLGGVGTGLSQIFGTNFPDYGVQVQLNIPLLNRAAQADYTRDQLAVRQQEIRLRQVQKQVAVEISNALIAVEQSRAAYEAAREARVFQEQSLEAEREKYNVGASTNFLVIQYQRDLAQAQSAEVAALADYAKARAALQRATGSILEEYSISITDAYRGTMPQPPAPAIGPPRSQQP
jgi:outer membrane protein